MNPSFLIWGVQESYLSSFSLNILIHEMGTLISRLKDFYKDFGKCQLSGA